LKLCIVGSFYPEVSRLSTATTGLAYVMMDDPSIDSIRIIAPISGRLPPGFNPKKVEVIPVWSFDDVLLVLRAACRLLQMRRDVDLYLFNVYLGSFGNSRAVNMLGLLLPTTVRVVTGRKVVTYMHNFVETQQVEKLGYRAGVLVRTAAKIVEKTIAKTTTLIVPLPSQEAELARHGIESSSSFLPYLEGVWSFETFGTSEIKTHDMRVIKLLLFGAWGPQKRIAGVLSDLKALIDDGMPLIVTVAGSINARFPQYEEIVRVAASQLPPGHVNLSFDVQERDLPGLFQSNDAIILPYDSTGGYSGVMNIAALYGLRIVAYDNPQLRETDRLLESGAVFVTPGDRIALRNALLELLAGPNTTGFATKETVSERAAATRGFARRLLKVVMEQTEKRIRVSEPV
jgi:glycosyltransferase involved in cell wall biosynthesis